MNRADPRACDLPSDNPPPDRGADAKHDAAPGESSAVTLPVELSTAGTDSASRIEQLRSHASAPDRYRLRGRIGRGGQGAVYEVWDEDLLRRLAMKVVSGSNDARSPSGTPTADAETVSRFLQEAQITGQLDHPGVVPVHELGLDSNGHLFFTMRLVRGENLHKIIRKVHAGQDGRTLLRGLGALLKACDALAYAHAKRVIHRDLKPSNLMVGQYGEVYVMDWGLARVLGQQDRHDLSLREAASQPSALKTDRRESREGALESPLVTMDGQVMGTPSYMPPEQALGQIEKMGPPSDVYSMGAVLYELLTGHMPYVPPDGQISPRTLLARVLEGPPKPVTELAPDAPAELVTICEKAMARHMEERYPNMEALALDLQAYLEGRVVAAHERGAWAELRKWVLRNRGWATTGAVALLLLVGALGWALIERGRADGEAKQAKSSLREVERLSDLRALPFLEREAYQKLWPALPEKIPAMDQWLLEARSLSGNAEAHRSFLADLRSRSMELNPEQRVELERLSAFVADLDNFLPRIAEIETRRAFASSIVRRSIDEHRALWDETVAAIANRDKNPRYDGLELKVQTGLVPIGQDRDSGFFEFVHLQTGEIPVLNPRTGKLDIDERSGLVFVLLPGGTFRMGAEPPAPDRPVGFPNVDADVRNVGELKMIEEVGPVHEVHLDPFFLSKYEMTQAQWKRVTGENPSEYSINKPFHSGAPTKITWRNPVETVSWWNSFEILRRLELVLPTEAQWEYAYRGGTSTPYYSGENFESLKGHENIADEEHAKYWLNWGESFEKGWTDGYLAHAPVGTYLPNPFGLHDMGGNVSEWCLDSWGSYTLPVAAGNGERQVAGNPAARIYRGARFSDTRQILKAAARASGPAHRMNMGLGLRPARPIFR